MGKVQRATALLDRFELNELILPKDAENLIVGVFEACGHVVSDKGFIGSDEGADCFVRTSFNGISQTVGVEVKAGMRPADVESVLQAFNLKESCHFDRSMVVARSGFSIGALRHADTIGLGQVDLFNPADLRNWLKKQVQADDAAKAYERIVRHAMQDLARVIAEHPNILAQLEWRDLERVLRETFEGIGFDTRLTRPGKDGGFDLELTTSEGGRKRIYLVEIKHWSEQKPGSSHLKKFIRAVASRQAAGGLLLSTSGFAGTIYSGIAEFSTPVRLGDGDKVVALCKTYYRLHSALWMEDVNLQEPLLSDTRAIGEYR